MEDAHDCRGNMTHKRKKNRFNLDYCKELQTRFAATWNSRVNAAANDVSKTNLRCFMNDGEKAPWQMVLYQQKITKKLECPYTQNADETWIAELIFTPGEPRNKILQWLLSKSVVQMEVSAFIPGRSLFVGTFIPLFHRSLYNSLETACCESESRLKALLHISSTVGLCRPSDLELIEGRASPAKQVKFLDKLLDLVEIEDENANVKSTSSGTVSCLTDQYSTDAALIDCLAQQKSLSHIFPSHMSILPQDINTALDMTAVSCSADRDDRLLNMEDMIKRVGQLKDDLGRQNELFKHLESEHLYTEVDINSRHTALRKLRLVMSELQQMIVSFSYFYEGHIQLWCNRESPPLSPLGHKIVTVLRLLNSFTTMLGAMKVIKVSDERLQNIVPSYYPLEQSAVGGDGENGVSDRLYQALNDLEHKLNLSTSMLGS